MSTCIIKILKKPFLIIQISLDLHKQSIDMQKIFWKLWRELSKAIDWNINNNISYQRKHTIYQTEYIHNITWFFTVNYRLKRITLKQQHKAEYLLILICSL